MSSIYETILADIKTARVALEAGRHIIFGYLGMPGIGKTDMIRSAAEACGLEFYGDMVLSGCSPLDIVGKIPCHVTQTLHSYPNYDIPTEERVDDKPALWFIDEITNATSDTIKALQQGVLSRKFGKHRLGKNVIIMLAGNRQSDKAGSGVLSSAMYNRVTWRNIEWTPAHSADAVSHLFGKYGIIDEAAKPEAIKQQRETLAQIEAYLRFKPILADDFTNAVKRLGSEAFTQWLSPRSLEALIVRTKANGWVLPSINDVAGDIGAGRAAELVAFGAVMGKVPDFAKVCAGEAVDAPSQLDVKFATVASFAAQVALAPRHKDKPHPFKAVFEFIKGWADLSLKIVFIASVYRQRPAAVNWPEFAVELRDPQMARIVGMAR